MYEWMNKRMIESVYQSINQSNPHSNGKTIPLLFQSGGNDWSNEWMNEWMNEWIMNELMNEWMNE